MVNEILFDINKKVDLSALDEAIRKDRRWTRFEDSLNNRGYSGLELDWVEVDGVKYNRLLVIWTDDGKNGYERDNLTDLQIQSIKEVIDGQP